MPGALLDTPLGTPHDTPLGTPHDTPHNHFPSKPRGAPTPVHRS
jgi:hypothetical protein